ncbi:hypothetical protein SAMN04489737_1007 [Arcanobacterium phocae]|uniref:Uncharacterized protein n=1 Tax=Arcanobacterium phocae TaxID=131112 RepID=A0A1H2LHD9_9ACTO|nr:hypothetical protein [Arcanobacterium phocae]SDU79816.1 hypothetical protein SAMN04489737_1007 [Arcanobacterium phocae]
MPTTTQTTKSIWVNGVEYTYVNMEDVQRVAQSYEYIAFDGCHKIYIFNDDVASYFNNNGYTIDILTPLKCPGFCS